MPKKTLLSLVLFTVLLLTFTSVSAASFTVEFATGNVIIDLPGGGTEGNANPYPINLTVSGLEGVISDLNLYIDITHGRAADIELELEAPDGDRIWLIDDACEGSPHGIVVTFDDQAAAPIPSPCDLDISAQTTIGTTGSTTALATFNGDNPNGVWKLYARDDFSGQSGSIGYWALQFTIDNDTTPPSATMTSAALPSTNISPIPVQVDLSEPVTDFTVNTLELTNATAEDFTGSGTSYTFNLVPSTQGTVSATIPAGSIHDRAGNANTAAAEISRIYDTVQPTVTITSTAIDPTNQNPIPVAIHFSKSVIGFIKDDIDVGNGSAENFAGSGADYSFDLFPNGQGLVTVDVAADVAEDAAGNGNTAAAQFSIEFDTDAPSINITTTATNPTNLTVIPYTATFSKNVTGFDLDDVQVTNGSAANFGGSGAVYTFDILPELPGLVTIDIPADAAQDAASNLSLAAQTSIGYQVAAGNIVTVSVLNDAGTVTVTVPNPAPGETPVFTLINGDAPATIDPATGVFVWNFADRIAPGLYRFSVFVQAGSLTFESEIQVNVIEAPLPPPPAPNARDINFNDEEVARIGVPDALADSINVRVLYQNGAPSQWLGNPLYHTGNIGVEGLDTLGIRQAIDIFSPNGLTYFNGGAVFCLKGSGYLIWLAASQSPRHPEIIGSYEVPEFPGFTCATLFEPGTLVLVAQNPAR